MNKERAREILEERKTRLETQIKEMKRMNKYKLLRNKYNTKPNEKEVQALDIAIDSLQEDKFVLLQCTDGRIFVVDSKKSIDDLESESCKKCKRIDELKEIRMENKFFTRS